MPIYKARLSHTEEAMHRCYLRQLHAEGLDVEIADQWLENSRALDVVLARPAESTVFESLTGGVYYAILVRLIAIRSGLILTDWGLATSYGDQIVPASFDDSDPLWNLGGQLYRPSEVLNSRIEKNLILAKGQTVEGWFLASGIVPIPIEYGRSAVVPFRLSFWDQFGNEIGVDGRLSVLRKVQRDSTGVRKGTGLYGLDETGKPPELSVAEASRLRYLEMVRQEKEAAQKGAAGIADPGAIAEVPTAAIARGWRLSMSSNSSKNLITANELGVP